MNIYNKIGRRLILLPIILYIFSFFIVSIYSVIKLIEPPVLSDAEYDGLIIDIEEESQQHKPATCGHAALAYLLNMFQIPASEKDIEDFTELDGWLSFYDMALYVESKDLQYQSLEVGYSYFEQNPTSCIMHVEWGHFITFIGFDNRGDCIIFDPARGLILLEWSELKEIWDGYIFYVYE